MTTHGLDFLNGCLQILSDNSKRILSFQKNLETDFEKKLLEAAINNLLDIHNPLRFNNFSYAMRELVDHVLNRLAPDDYVNKCTWYTVPDGTRNVVRPQRVKYAIQKGLSDNFVLEELKIDISTVLKNIRRIIQELNKYTHVTEDTFDVDPVEQLQKISSFLETNLELFEIIERIRTEIIDTMIDHIEREVLDEILDNYSKLEEYATHAYWGDHDIVDIELVDLDYEELRFRVYGEIEPEFQMGSDSDVRKGNGMVFTKRIPFDCILLSDVTDPYELRITDFNMQIDDDGNFWKGIQVLED